MKTLVGTFVIAAIAAMPARTPAQERLRVATTTSVQDSGLLPYLLPNFEQREGCKIDVIAVGTGQALTLASNGDVDMVIVHDPIAEMEFVGKGAGVNRTTIMRNDFVIVGPDADSAKVRGVKSAQEALEKIRKASATWISRGDKSGTNQKEMQIWKETGTIPAGEWYLEIGQGMGAALTMADQKQAYTLSDRGTYLARKSKLKLAILFEGDPEFGNPYSAMAVNPQRFPAVKYVLAKKLIDWLCSESGQKLIGEHRVDGNQLFTPSCKAAGGN
ncbi:MAG: substrate-binding domain-containing protein [Acidobacteriota bacterium]